jgi:putative ABC transport system permease protein
MMRRARALLLRLFGTVFPGRRDRDLALELETHLQMHVDDNMRAGMPPDEARRRALIQLGGVAQTTERYRDRRGFPALDALRQDLAYALRMLRRNPGFTCTAVLTLALGIGANTAIFSVVNAVLLRPLPFPNADRLVMIFATDRQRGDDHDVSSFPDFVDWKNLNRTFDGLAAFTSRAMPVVVDGADADLVDGKQVSPEIFEVLGVQPALGRSFRHEEQEAGASRVTVLTDGFWKRRMGGAADVLGRTIHINDNLYTIVGVMPPDFQIAAGTNEQLYVPLVIDVSRGHGFLRVIGRLRPGVLRADAQADMDRVTASLAVLYPRNDANVGTNLTPLVDAFAINIRSGLFVLLGVVGAVLLIACTNVAGLLLARGVTRRRELAMRAALGAGRARIARQLLTESLTLAFLGGGLGLAIADATARLLSAFLAASFQVPRADAVHTDIWVLGFTAIVSLATGLLFGVVPALSSASLELNADLRDSSRNRGGIRGPRLRSALVIVETALAVVLLAGAAVLLRTFMTMRNTSPGFRTDDVFAAEVWLPQPRFLNVLDRVRFYNGVLTRLRGRPGIQSAAFVSDLPLGGGSDTLGFHIVGRPDPSPRRPFSAGFNLATPDYFRTMGIPVKTGREFNEADRIGSTPVVVINETAARRFWTGESPLDRQIALPGANRTSTTLTIVGVTGDVRHESLAVPPRAEFFICSLQAPLPWTGSALVVRTAHDPAAMAADVRAVVRSVDPNVPVRRTGKMSDVLAVSIAEPRVYTFLLGAFATLAVALAAVGLYGLVSYAASRRMHEMGVRVALGASRGEILRTIIGQGWRLAAIGSAIGVAAGLGATRTLVGLVRGLEPNDPAAFVVVVAVLMIVALAASYLPARRAARVEPMRALRAE